eukprot:3184867-Amphidinium_carterae.1
MGLNILNILNKDGMPSMPTAWNDNLRCDVEYMLATLHCFPRSPITLRTLDNAVHLSSHIEHVH